MPAHIDEQNKARAQKAWKEHQAAQIRAAGTPKERAERDAKQNAAAAVVGARAYLARLQYAERNNNWALAVQRAEKAVKQAEANARAAGVSL
jgi:hypothetical protein